MQVGAVSSMNFRSNNLQKNYEDKENQNKSLPKEFIIIDTEEVNNQIDKIREFEKEVLPKTKYVVDENGEAHEIKNPIQTAVSLLAVAAIAFAFTKKMTDSIIKNEAVQNIYNKFKHPAKGSKLKAVQDTFKNNKKLSTLKNTITNSKKLEAVKNFKPVASVTEFVNSSIQKHGKDKVAGNIAGVTGATAATIYSSRSDSNNDGVADIAQKGVNWYEGALKKGGALANVIDALT